MPLKLLRTAARLCAFKSFEGVDRKVHLAKYYAEREHELEVWEQKVRDEKLKEKLNGC